MTLDNWACVLHGLKTKDRNLRLAVQPNPSGTDRCWGDDPEHFENPAVHEQAIVQEITQATQVQILELIQQQIVEPIDVLALAVTFAVPSQQLRTIIKAITTGVNLDITGLLNSQFSATVVEASAPQAVGSFPPSEEFGTPVYNQIHQERIVAAQNTFEKPDVQE